MKAKKFKQKLMAKKMLEQRVLYPNFNQFLRTKLQNRNDRKILEPTGHDILLKKKKKETTLVSFKFLATALPQFRS